jgi:predicted O-methyltransferase YrrM
MPTEKTPVNMLEDIAIDDAHCDLIYGLVRSQKPRSILEIGYGSGRSSLRIRQAVNDNRGDCDYTIVDNWHDWNGSKPTHTAEAFEFGATIVEMDEGEFVNSCRETFDFILIDADHSKSEQYFDRVYWTLTNTGGILIYHDVTNRGWPNLYEIKKMCIDRDARYRLFNKNSSPGERCDRGLLVIFK